MSMTFCLRFQKRNFFLRQPPNLTLFECGVKHDRADADAAKRLDTVAAAGKHSSNLMIFALADNNAGGLFVDCFF